MVLQAKMYIEVPTLPVTIGPIYSPIVLMLGCVRSHLVLCAVCFTQQGHVL